MTELAAMSAILEPSSALQAQSYAEPALARLGQGSSIEPHLAVAGQLHPLAGRCQVLAVPVTPCAQERCQQTWDAR